MKKTVLLLSILLCLFMQHVVSQSVNLPEKKPELVSFDVLSKQMEGKFNMKIYYKSDWFAGKLFSERLTNLSLQEFFDAIARLTEINSFQINSSTYILTPAEIRNYTNRTNSKGMILVGEKDQTNQINEAVVSGKITDMQTGKALPGVRINIDKLNYVDYTDKNGNYTLKIPLGEYDLRLNFGDYKENLKMIRVYGNGIVNFEMAEIAILLREVLVMDKAADMNISRTQMSAIKFNNKTIKELPLYLGEKDIIKSVTLLPGIQSTGEFGTGFFVRGGGSDQNLILIEDVPIFNSSHLFGLISAVNSDGVNNVNLLKAGIPAKYGERASSVMDIRLNNYSEKTAVKGGIGLLNSRLNVEVPLFDKKVSLLAGFRNSYSNWLLHAMPDAELKNSNAFFYDMNALLTVRLNPENSLSLYGYFSHDVFSFIKNSPYHYDNFLTSLRYTHIFNDKLNASLVLGHSRYLNEINQVDSLKPKESYQIGTMIQYSNAKLNFNWEPSKNHLIEFGINSILYNIEPGNISPLGLASEILAFRSNAEKALENACYISDNITFSPAFSVEAGFRFTHYSFLGPNRVFVFDENGPHTVENITDTLQFGNNMLIKKYLSPEPRLSMRYIMDKFSSVKFSYNRISQFINLISNTTVMSPTDVYKLSNTNVPPMTAHQFALGYYRNFENNEYETSIECYYKYLKNIVEYRDGARILMNPALDADLIKANGLNYGVELYVKKNTGKLTGWASYTFSRSLRKTSGQFDEDKIVRNEYYPSNFDKPHNFIINATYHLTRRWRLAGIFNYSTGKPVTLPELKYTFNGKQYIYYSDRNKYRLADYHRFDIALSFDETLRFKQFWKGSWTFSILNLYAQKNPYSVFYKTTSPLATQYFQKFNLYQLFIIERPIPTITYNFTF